MPGCSIGLFYIPGGRVKGRLDAVRYAATFERIQAPAQRGPAEEMRAAEKPSLIPASAFQTGAPEGTLGAEEELWLADPGTLKLAGGAQKILAAEPEDSFSGELIDCEIESNTGVHPDPSSVAGGLGLRRAGLLGVSGGGWVG